jgi:hypothetical protein
MSTRFSNLRQTFDEMLGHIGLGLITTIPKALRKLETLYETVSGEYLARSARKLYKIDSIPFTNVSPITLL